MELKLNYGGGGLAGAVVPAAISGR